MRMPRGAMPTPRSELAASEPYRSESIAEIFIPSGEFPTSNQEIAAARPSTAAPESFLAWPMATWSSAGIIDRQSLINIAGEARARNPTTIVKKPGG
jgi:hypothetical protein